MLEHFSYIPQAHQIALTAAIRNHNMGTGINPALLGRLYKLALDGLTQPVTENGCFTSTLASATATLSTATDAKSGIYVQLTRLADQPKAFLTFGQKWCVEGQNTTLSNCAMNFW